MADPVQVPNSSKLFSEKLRSAIDLLSKRSRDGSSTELTTVLSDVLVSFKKFFLELGDPEFNPRSLRTGDTVRSEPYNDNLKEIFNDIKRFHKELTALEDTQIKAYNYAQIVNKEIITRANILASTVLDLNILSNFTRGDVIVAGDDFRSLNYIDQTAGTASTRADRVFGGNGVSLARDRNRYITSQDASIEVVPLSPSSASVGQGVTTKPTPGNLERFYEGCYYNFMGLARPEGSGFNFKYILDQNSIEKTTTTEGEASISSQESKGYYVDLGASEADKKSVRGRLLDSDPDTYWECEFLYRVNRQLIDPLKEDIVVENPNKPGDESSNTKLDNPEAPAGASVIIDLNAAETAAQDFDYEGRDLIVDLIISFREPQNVNLVSINPVIFGSQAFPSIEDIATATDKDGQFTTVDGWDNIKFAKTITPEANEFLTDTQIGQTLAPNRYEYTGQGVYPFPVRVAKKVRIRLRMDRPVAAPYERYIALLKKQITTDSTVTTTTKRGLFR